MFTYNSSTVLVFTKEMSPGKHRSFTDKCNKYCGFRVNNQLRASAKPDKKLRVVVL